MSKLKAKDCACPICGAPADTFPTRTKRKARCSNGNCDLASYCIDLDQWNTRPRERELEAGLTKASEVMTIARDVIVMVSKDCRQGCGCYKCDALANHIRPALSAINAVLGKGGE